MYNTSPDTEVIEKTQQKTYVFCTTSKVQYNTYALLYGEW